MVREGTNTYIQRTQPAARKAYRMTRFRDIAPRAKNKSARSPPDNLALGKPALFNSTSHSSYVLRHVCKVHVVKNLVTHSKLKAARLMSIFLVEIGCKFKRLYSTNSCRDALKLNARQIF